MGITAWRRHVCWGWIKGLRKWQDIVESDCTCVRGSVRLYLYGKRCDRVVLLPCGMRGLIKCELNALPVSHLAWNNDRSAYFVDVHYILQTEGKTESAMGGV